MYTKRVLMEGITREFEILKHLGSKVTKKNAEFRFSEAQRSIEELEHYIVSSFPAQIKLMTEGMRNMDSYTENVKRVEKFTWKRFNIELNKSLRLIKKEIRSKQHQISMDIINHESGVYIWEAKYGNEVKQKGKIIII